GGITLTALEDATDEPNEIIDVSLGSLTNATPGAVTSLSATILDDDLATFGAQTVTPTSAGVQIQLNRAPDLSTINLYNGTADVTLVGQPTGPVTGSLIIDAANRVTFVRTGGVLADDSYTLTVRSAADGFKDTLGALLDGNRDGTPGDDLVFTFAVNNAGA